MRGENCTGAQAEVNNARCQVKGTLPTPGYTYQGSALTWPTLPEILERAGVAWKIYQDPNDNWMGLMHGGLAFAGFREAHAGSPLYEKGMSNHSLAELAQDAKSGVLPQVSWILPPMLWSEHPAPSSSVQGAEFTSRVLEALTANSEVWGKTVLFLSFDENDGLFDHVPPPAPPSYHLDGTLAGKSTLDLRGEYFSDPERKSLHPDDQVSGTVRPWGLGPRVPLYVVSPWSRGGWVNSQVFDHTSVGQFLEKRFGISVPAISPWHRAVCGDLTSAFDFATPNQSPFPPLPYVSNAAGAIAAVAQRPKPVPPLAAETAYQETGVRRSRALPYELHVEAQTHVGAVKTALTFRNTGQAGAVLHVYDRLHLDRIPRRYTLEAGKSLTDEWPLGEDDGRYDLWVYGPNGYLREFLGKVQARSAPQPEVTLIYDPPNSAIEFGVSNPGEIAATLLVRSNAYGNDGPRPLQVAPHGRVSQRFTLLASRSWYDFTVSGEDFEHRFAGRMEIGADGFSDPAI